MVNHDGLKHQPTNASHDGLKCLITPGRCASCVHTGGLSCFSVQMVYRENQWPVGIFFGIKDLEHFQ